MKNLIAVPAFNDQTVIKAVVENPKRNKAKVVFGLYKPGMTVGAFAAAYAKYQKTEGARKCNAEAHIKWDAARGYVTLEG